VCISEYRRSLEHDIHTLLANSPHAFAWLHETGAPVRAKLFKLARTTYWIVYTVDDDAQCVDILRFWHSARDPESFEI
jgi:plasmid stabilization system protein ParE